MSAFLKERDNKKITMKLKNLVFLIVIEKQYTVLFFSLENYFLLMFKCTLENITLNNGLWLPNIGIESILTPINSDFCIQNSHIHT